MMVKRLWVLVALAAFALAGCTLKRYDTQTGTANPLIPSTSQEQLG